MSMYTKDSKEPGEIYFLNDDNIAFGKTEMDCAAGFNAVASQKEFVEAYGEFGAVSSDLYSLSGKTEMSAVALDGKIDAVSAAADAKFLHKSGGAVDHLSVNNGLTAGGELKTDFITVDGNCDISITGAGLRNHGSLNIGFEGGLNNISAGGASLSSHIDGAIGRAINETEIVYDENTHYIRLINTRTGLTSEFDADKFIKDGFLNNVSSNVSGDSGHRNPPYLVFTWNTDSGKDQTWLEVKDFAILYKTDDQGIDERSLVDSYNIKLNYGYVARLSDVQDLRSDVGALQTYATELSAP